MKTRSTLTGSKHTAAEYEAAKDEPVELVPPVAAQWKAPQFVWEVRRAARRDALSRQPDRLPRGRQRRLQGHHHARPEAAEDRREVGLRRRPRTERQEPVGDPGQPQDPRIGAVLDPRPARSQHPQRGGRRDRLPDRRGPRLRRVRRATRPRATRSSSPSSTSSPTAGASPARRSSRSTTPSASTTRP